MLEKQYCIGNLTGKAGGYQIILQLQALAVLNHTQVIRLAQACYGDKFSHHLLLTLSGLLEMDMPFLSRD